MDSLSTAVVQWQRTHGRHDLPWQTTRDPYRVWLSEIMLQQTQVRTVLGYYQRFLDQFPTVMDLAQASQGQVLELWSGLGYYSRARNLHACAQRIATQYGGVFPRTAQELSELPGIGRSTAAAIAAFCYSERTAILDGNVKRVLSRVLGFDADLAQSAHERQLWQRAQDLLPHDAQDMPNYTQGLMDLGATVCTTRKPLCSMCPLQAQCYAQQHDCVAQLPVRTRKLKRSAQQWWLLLAYSDQGHVWLQRRPQQGIWAGLECPPVFDSLQALKQALPATQETPVLQEAAPFLHVLTHRDLHLHPVWWRTSIQPEPLVLVHTQAQTQAQHSHAHGQWVLASDWPHLGLPAPVKKILQQPVVPSIQYTPDQG